MRSLILIALIGAAFAAPNSLQRSHQRIVGGSPATIQEFPYMANLQFDTSGVVFFHICGGTLITSRTVLTGANCIYTDVLAWWRVVLGSSSAWNGGVSHTVQSFTVHPQWNAITLENDIAIVRLVNNAVLTDTVGLASIAGNLYNLADGTEFTTIGWGYLTPNGGTTEQLQQVNVNQINQALCTERYAFLRTQPGFQNWPEVTQGMLCTGVLNQGGRDTCDGDQGGPIAHTAAGLTSHVVVGIISWGFSCADPVYPSVNTRVSAYSDWIVANGSA